MLDLLLVNPAPKLLLVGRRGLENFEGELGSRDQLWTLDYQEAGSTQTLRILIIHTWEAGTLVRVSRCNRRRSSILSETGAVHQPRGWLLSFLCHGVALSMSCSGWGHGVTFYVSYFQPYGLVALGSASQQGHFLVSHYQHFKIRSFS